MSALRTSWITLSFSPRNVMLSKSSHGVACGGRQWVTIFHASNVFIARQLYRRIVTSGRDDISAERPKNWTKMGANSCPVSTPWFLFNRPLWGNEIHHRWNRSTEESNLSAAKMCYLTILSCNRPTYPNVSVILQENFLFRNPSILLHGHPSGKRLAIWMIQIIGKNCTLGKKVDF